MSYPGLVGHTDHSQASGEKLFDKIIFFVIECRAPEMTYRRGVIDNRGVLFVHECTLPRFPDAVGHHVHRALQWNLLPLASTRCAVLHLRFTPCVREQLISRGPLRAEDHLPKSTFR